MTTRSIRSAHRALATLTLVLVLGLVLARGARAADGDGQTDEGWKKVLAFARCALNVFRAVTPTDWAVATLDCGRLMIDEPSNYPGGGQP